MATVETDLIQQPATGPAKDVMMVIAVNADGSPISGGGGVAATWETLEGKPDFIGAGATAAEARTAIGAGTSSLVIGTTATTAKAGDYAPTWAQVTGKPTTFAPIIGTSANQAMAGNTVIPPALSPGSAVADAVDETDVVAQFNALLASLRSNGVIAT